MIAIERGCHFSFPRMDFFVILGPVRYFSLGHSLFLYICTMMKKYFYGGLLSLVAGTLFSLGLPAQEIRVQVDENEIITTVADTTLVVEILQRIAGEVRRATDVKATTVKAPDVQAGDVKAGDVKARDVIASDGETTARAALVAARALLDQPYVASTLEGGEREQPRIFLTRTDCILFVEACHCLAHTALTVAHPSFADYARNVVRRRYREPMVRYYSDRIHYTTEWVRRAEADGWVHDITLDLGGSVWEHPIWYMSHNASKYEHLKNAGSDPVQQHDLEVIARVENDLNTRPHTFISRERVAAAADGIRSGDIICYCSGVEGLDIAHVAMAWVTDPEGNLVFGDAPAGSRIGFVHASMAGMKVKVDPKTIADYVADRKGLSGIKVVRPY